MAVVATDAPLVTESVPRVAMLPLIVPSVLVPVEAVMVEPKVVAPRMVGIVAVLMVAVLIVAVLMVAVLMVAVLADRVPMVAVPVEAVRLAPKVTAPVRREVPSTERLPVLLTPVVDRDRAEDVLSPSVIT